MGIMAETRVTEKFQITIPKEVRKVIGLKPGEILTVEATSEGELIIKRFVSVKDPLKILIGEKKFKKHVPIEELEEMMEGG